MKSVTSSTSMTVVLPGNPGWMLFQGGPPTPNTGNSKHLRQCDSEKWKVVLPGKSNGHVPKYWLFAIF